MHVHVLGVCGTFMGGLALLAQELGHRVTGSDRASWPPIGPMLENAGVRVLPGYDAAHLHPRPDLVVIGNALSRGNPEVEAVLDAGIPYLSGPQWLAGHVLAHRRVLAVAGTHGKTTTTSMVAWMLEHAGLAPGFLVGGMPENFGRAARLGGGEWFVIEADEYDTAFFDKRSKFIHYRPEILVINNIEFDHADIFPDLAAIQRQFHYLVRTVPGRGRIIRPVPDPVVDATLALGCWSPRSGFGTGPDADWRVESTAADGSAFAVHYAGAPAVSVPRWALFGQHNVLNACAAVAACAAAGVPPAVAGAGLEAFLAPRRRLELLGRPGGICLYDDFAHHPTAIAATLAALRARVGEGRILAVLEPRSNTMRMGVQREALAPALAAADRVFLLAPADLSWDLADATSGLAARRCLAGDPGALAAAVVAEAREGDHVLVMSNGDFGGIHRRLLEALGSGAAARP